MSLTRIEMNIASEVFARYAKRDFAYGYYNMAQPVQYTNSTSSATAMPTYYTQVINVTQVPCKATVAGLDQSLFMAALEEYLERSKEELYNILANE